MAHKFDPQQIARLDNPERGQFQSIEAFLDVLRPWTGMAYADIGCGPGYFTLPVAEPVGYRGKVYAIDAQPAMLQELERRAQDKRLRNVITVRSSEREIPLPPSRVDAACMANTFHELEEPLALLSEVRRILKPSGRLIVIDWKPIETPMGPPLSERVSLARIDAALRAVGFERLCEHAVYPYHHVVEAV